jgi:sugar phosphate isomerase/epimerase
MTARSIVARSSPRLHCSPLRRPGRPRAGPGRRRPLRRRTRRIRSSCNLYSFNAPLTRGEMRLEEVLEFCAEVGFDAVDPTGYYFTGYPHPPSHAEVHRIKQWAFRLGLDISGTGVRNDFSTPDPVTRRADVEHVSRWVDVAARLGAPVLRVFAGRAVPAGHTRPETLEWIVEALHASVAAAERQGVVIVLQNHDDVLKTARRRSRSGGAWPLRGSA